MSRSRSLVDTERPVSVLVIAFLGANPSAVGHILCIAPKKMLLSRLTEMIPVPQSSDFVNQEMTDFVAFCHALGEEY